MLRQLALKSLVEHECKALLEYFKKRMVAKKDKQSTQLVKALLSYDPHVLDMVLFLFMRRQILYYTVRFLTWRMKNCPTSDNNSTVI
jgi:hypothetical protein